MNSFLEAIVNDIKAYHSKLIIIKNPEPFLFRSDVKDNLSKRGIRILDLNGLKLRIDFELNAKSSKDITIYLVDSSINILEDIRKELTVYDFSLLHYFMRYPITDIQDLKLSDLDLLLHFPPESNLKSNEINIYLEQLQNKPLDLALFRKRIDSYLTISNLDWFKISFEIAKALNKSIGKPEYVEVIDKIHEINIIFQGYLKKYYKSLYNSNPLKKPKIVSKILDHLNSNYYNEKIALIVLDGFSFWQYLIFRDFLKEDYSIKEDFTFSWIPSITQLSRQAIFKGSTPESDYIQNPVSERNLWFKYWSHKGIKDFQIAYFHDKVNLDELTNVSKLGIVYKDLDEKMHNSDDYTDLLDLTKNWYEKSEVFEVIYNLIEDDYNVFLTSDHGNVPVKGYRNLTGREKLGSNKSGSRSTRHIEYNDSWLADEFIQNNKDIEDSIIREDNVIYLSDDLSFTSKQKLVTHGGSHILEVLIPFIRITR